MYGIIADILRGRTTAEWIALFERCNIPCAPMNDLDALIDDPHLAAVGFFQTLTHPTEGSVRYTAIPSRWNEPHCRSGAMRRAWASTASKSSRTPASRRQRLKPYCEAVPPLTARPESDREATLSRRIAGQSPMA